MARNSSRSTLPEISFTTRVWKERAAYVAYSPELDVSSCGKSPAKARTALREAVSLFLEECARKGTLQAILAEAGFERRGKSYGPRPILYRAKDRVSVPSAS